ncbi:hypothetical protein [Microvirga roseola]|uniref:hypothetical protein n=1 Tax=Microvirga roseola TaxID=2883126 RepID=UPI001E4F574E|nr:hypothetical protein [Microvirga roseola]
MKSMMVLGRTLAGFAALCVLSGSLRAEEFQIEEAPSIVAVTPAQLRPRTVIFSDRGDDKEAGLIRFEDWARERPVQKQFLSPFPGYQEPTIRVAVHGIPKSYVEKLHMYVAEARFLIAKPPETVDLTRYASLDMLEKIDPTIRHRRISAGEARPYTDPQSAHNRHPDRRWCEAPQSLCIESRYPLEGKLPIGIRLANKLEEGGKKISEFMEFQSEIRVLPPEDVDQEGLSKLTGLDTPVSGVLEQTLFDVNQVMQFGKLLAILQEHPSDKSKTVTTLFMALAVETDVLERKREFGSIPVLRNLIPAQVLMGRSSFNTGDSISAGLPDYARNRIRGLAGLLDR